MESPSVEYERPGAASAFEVKYRAWIITAIYLVALACFRFDRRDIGFLAAGALAALVPVSTTARCFYFLAAFLAFVAAFIRTWTSAYSLSEPVGRGSTSSLNQSANGPYRFVRHPGYLAMILLFLGFGLLLNPLGFLLLLAGMTTLVCRLLRREQGSAASALALPSLLPAVRRSLPPAAGVPQWPRALLREAYLWSFGVTLVTLAVTLQERWFYIALAISLSIQAFSALWPTVRLKL